MKYSEVIPGESIAAQHIVMVMEYRIRQDKRRKLCDRQIRWQKIRKREGNDAYTTALFEKLESSDGHICGKDIERILISTTKVVFEETSGKAAFNEEES